MNSSVLANFCIKCSKLSTHQGWKGSDLWRVSHVQFWFLKTKGLEQHKDTLLKTSVGQISVMNNKKEKDINLTQTLKCKKENQNFCLQPYLFHYSRMSSCEGALGLRRFRCCLGGRLLLTLDEEG